MKRAKPDHQTTSESFIEMLFNLFPDGAVITDEDEAIIEANPEFCRMFGCESENIQGKQVNDVVARRPACGKTDPAVSETLARTGRIYLETERSGRDGRLFPVAIHVARIDIPEGGPCFLGIYRDLSGHDEIAKSFFESEIRFREMYESVPFGLYRTTPDGRILDANPSLVRMLGYKTLEELQKSRNLEEEGYEPSYSREQFRQELERDGFVRQLESAWTRRDGGQVFIRETAWAVRDEQGDVTHYEGMVEDITVIREVENQKQQSEKALQETVSKLKKTQKGIFHTIAKMLEMRDPYTSGHQERTALLAVAIGREMELDDEKLEALEVSAMIHDIGKLEVPAEILSKPGKLSEIEFSLLKGHPESAGKILGEMDYPWPVDTIVLQHHERLDGSGYPHGLAGDDICMEARILAVADVVEAMCSHRPYRPAKSLDEALDEIRNGRGVAFDADVVDACVSLFESERFSF